MLSDVATLRGPRRGLFTAAYRTHTDKQKRQLAPLLWKLPLPAVLWNLVVDYAVHGRHEFLIGTLSPPWTLGSASLQYVNDDDPTVPGLLLSCVTICGMTTVNIRLAELDNLTALGHRLSKHVRRADLSDAVKAIADENPELSSAILAAEEFMLMFETPLEAEDGALPS